MNVAVATASVSRQAGGLFSSVRRLHQCLANVSGGTTGVLALRDSFTDADLPEWLPLRPKAFRVRGPAMFGFAPHMNQALLEVNPDIVHSHGIWMYPSLAVTAWHRKTCRPYLISPRGMLDAWALRNGKWRKRLAGFLFERAHLQSAGCIHALCESEAQAIRDYGLRNPICVLPNGVDLPACETKRIPPWHGVLAEGKRVMLFLGRLHPKKGLSSLLRAWTRVQTKTREGWVLVIGGWDQGGHESQLQRLACELGLPFADIGRPEEVDSRGRDIVNCSVVFIGPQFGDSKEACHENCDAFVLPSLSEGLPMGILEAWSHAKAVLMTSQCNLTLGFDAGAAVQLSTDIHAMAADIGTFLGMSEDQRLTMATRGRRLVREKFVWDSIAKEMLAVYHWQLGGGPSPPSVIFS